MWDELDEVGALVIEVIHKYFGQVKYNFYSLLSSCPCIRKVGFFGGGGGGKG